MHGIICHYFGKRTRKVSNLRIKKIKSIAGTFFNLERDKLRERTGFDFRCLDVGNSKYVRNFQTLSICLCREPWCPSLIHTWAVV